MPEDKKFTEEELKSIKENKPIFRIRYNIKY